MSEYLEGFLDEVTLQALKQAENYVDEYQHFDRTRLMWYDLEMGTIYGFGKFSPFF